MQHQLCRRYSDYERFPDSEADNPDDTLSMSRSCIEMPNLREGLKMGPADLIVHFQSTPVIAHILNLTELVNAIAIDVG